MQLVWIDLETSGLDPVMCQILEISVALSTLDDPFNAKHVYHGVLGIDDSVHFDRIALEMHQKNGLLEECRQSKLHWQDVTEALSPLIPIVEDRDSKPTFAGASVHFDASFVRARDRYPRSTPFSSRFTHRVYDVSAIKLFCRSLGMPKLDHGQAHRTVADVNEAIAHAKMCAEWLKTWQLDAVLHPQFTAQVTVGEITEGRLLIAPPTQMDIELSYKRWFGQRHAGPVIFEAGPAKLIPSGSSDV